jgi:hypothetical protein
VTQEPRARTADRLAAGFLLLLMALGTLVLWIGVPVGCLWVASKLAGSSGEHFLIALPMCLAGMGLFGALLVWVNRLYLRVLGPTISAEDEEDEVERVLRGPLEPLLVGSLIIALVALVVWFFFFAENPPRQVI